MATQEYKFMNETVQADPTTGQVVSSSANVQTPIMQPNQINSAPLTFPGPTPSTVPDAVVASAQPAQKSLQDYINESTPQASALDKSQQALIDRYNELLPQSGGKQQALAQEQINQGIPTLQKGLTDLNNQILAGNAEYAKMVADFNQNSIALDTQLGVGNRAVLAVQQAGISRAFEAKKAAKSAEIGLLAARAQAQVGNINTALQLAQGAIDAKYAPIEDEIKIRQAQLEAIAPLLTRQDNIRAEALRRQDRDEQARITEEKAKAKENVALAFSANVQTKFTNKGGEFFRVADGKPYSNAADFLRDAGVKSFEEAYQKGLVTDITAQKIADMEFVTQLRNKYPDAGIEFGDDEATAVSKLANSNSYFKENYMKPEEPVGFPKPITINGQDYFQDPTTGELLPASAFIEGGVSSVGSKYISNTGAPLKLNPTQVEVLSGYESTSQTAASALQLLDAGVKSGLFTGTKLGFDKVFGIENQQQAQLEQQLAFIKAEFMKALSGAAVSEPEVKRLSAFLPSIKDQESVIRTKLNTLITETQRKQQNFLDTLGGQLNSSFNSAGNASDSTQVKGMIEKAKPLSYIDPNTIGAKANPIARITAKYPAGSVGGQCGDFVRRIVSNLGGNYARLGDSLKSKVSAVKKYGVPLSQARIGSVIVTKENPTYGHVAYIIGRNAKGWIVGESNFKQSNKVSYGRVIPFNSPKVVGVINPNTKS